MDFLPPTLAFSGWSSGVQNGDAHNNAGEDKEDFSTSGAPMPIIPGVPFTSHNNCRIFYLGSDEVHSNHCCQVIHTHLVDAGVQLYFV